MTREWLDTVSVSERTCSYIHIFVRVCIMVPSDLCVLFILDGGAGTAGMEGSGSPDNSLVTRSAEG